VNAVVRQAGSIFDIASQPGEKAEVHEYEPALDE
jgi:hypothetical protein